MCSKEILMLKCLTALLAGLKALATRQMKTHQKIMCDTINQ
jgi:hypothetical protein